MARDADRGCLDSRSAPKLILPGPPECWGFEIRYARLVGSLAKCFVSHANIVFKSKVIMMISGAVML